MSTASGSHRILVVDDDPVALLLMRAHLSKAGHTVVCVESVAQARLALGEGRHKEFDAVITDYRMPIENGLAMLAHVKELDPSLAVIIATAEGEKNLVASSLRGGAVDFLDKPFSKEDLYGAVGRAIGLTESQRLQTSAIDEVAQVGRTQRMLLGQSTKQLAERFNVYFRPHVQAGGDFVAAFPIANERFFVLVSDISGHDVQAAYRSAYLQGFARALIHNGAGIEYTFEQINDLLTQEWNTNDDEVLSLAACGVLVDLGGQQIQLMNCGLPSPFLVCAEGWAKPLDTARACPLGWFPSLPPLLTLDFSKERLLFWSDGVDDLAERLNCDPLSVCHRLMWNPPHGDAFFAEATDDIIAVRLDLASDSEGALQRGLPVFSQEYSGSAHEQIDQIQQYLINSLDVALPELSAEVLHDVVICIREALLNSLIHGCGGRDDKRASLSLCLQSEKALLRVRLQDEGPGYEFDIDEHEAVAGAEMIPFHHGLLMIKHLTKHFTIADHGRMLTMDFSTLPQE